MAIAADCKSAPNGSVVRVHLPPQVISRNSSIGRALRLGRRSCEFESRFLDKEEFFDIKKNLKK